MPKSLTLVELVEMLTRLMGDYEDEVVGEFERSGLTARQADHLEAVRALGNPNLVELAGKLGLSKPSITAIVEKLSEKGFVKKTQSDEDRRSFHLHLTAKGEKVARRHDEIHVRIADMLSKGLSKEELDHLVLLLNKVVVALK